MAPALVCAFAVAALLAAERTGSRVGVWLAKPIAAGSFVWAGLAWGALDTAYGRRLVAGLALCAAGDLLLIPRARPVWFRLGLGAFGLGHVAYGLACLALPLDAGAGALAALAMGLFAWRVLAWLAPQVPAELRLPVRAYVLVISAMVVLAAAATAAGAPLALGVGASAFALSDLSVARDRFAAPGFANAAWGLPLYFGAQLLLASSAATPA